MFTFWTKLSRSFQHSTDTLIRKDSIMSNSILEKSLDDIIGENKGNKRGNNARSGRSRIGKAVCKMNR